MIERDKEIEEAYRNAIYVVFDNQENETTFRIGEHSTAIDEILSINQAASFAFITAYNPYSKTTAKAENEVRQKALEQTVNALGLSFLNGYGTDENEKWQPEQSIFVFDISKLEAARIGREFRQNAVVYCEKGKRAELIWC